MTSAAETDEAHACRLDTPDTGQRHRCGSLPARSLTVTGPTAARSIVVTHRRRGRERSPPAPLTTTATGTVAAPALAVGATRGCSPTPCDERARSPCRSRDSAALAPTAPRSATSPTPTAVPQHTSQSIKPDRRRCCVDPLRPPQIWAAGSGAGLRRRGSRLSPDRLGRRYRTVVRSRLGPDGRLDSAQRPQRSAGDQARTC